MSDHRAGTRDEWLAARLELLESEKELTRRSDELARRGQELRRCYSRAGRRARRVQCHSRAAVAGQTAWVSSWPITPIASSISAGTADKMAEVVGVEFRLGKNAAVTRERVLATIRAGDNGHERRLAADIVAHATRLEQERTDAHIISRQ